MKESFWKLIFRNLLRVHSLYGVIFSIFLSIYLWQNSNDKTLPLLYFVVVLVLAVLVVSTLVSALMEVLRQSNLLPRIESVFKTKQDEVLCLLEPSSLFSHGISVSFYYTNEQNFEQLICIGEVVNIQENGKIQVKISFYQSHYEDIVARLGNNDNQVIKKIQVKPTVPSSVDFN